MKSDLAMAAYPHYASSVACKSIIGYVLTTSHDCKKE